MLLLLAFPSLLSHKFRGDIHYIRKKFSSYFVNVFETSRVRKMYVHKFEENQLEKLEEGWFRTDLGGEELWKDWKAVSVEYYEKKPGLMSSFHTHPNKQVTLLFQGKIRVYTKEQKTILQKMDSVFFEVNEPHKMEILGNHKATGINIFVPGRSPDFWDKRKQKGG